MQNKIEIKNILNALNINAEVAEIFKKKTILPNIYWITIIF